MKVNQVVEALDAVVPLQGLLGYLNFATGRPEPKFQKPFIEAYAFVAAMGQPRPWETLHQALEEKLKALHQQGVSAFSDIDQASHVLDLVFRHLVPAYRQHHRDLLFHLPEEEFWQPFFLVRCLEAVLAQRGPWEEKPRILTGALHQLNDYVGHRPIATLENRRRGEIYDHERLRPIPLYIRGVGAACGKYEPLIHQAMDILFTTDPGILFDAGLDPNLLDELALDPRGYDFEHPVDKRTNYCYGEWDPHHLDNQGRFRRFVLRRILLAGLWDRIETVNLPREEALFEAGAVLAGLMLMGAGVTGPAPTAYDSTINLGKLIPRIARFREAFYQGLLKKQVQTRAARLQQEVQLTRQPFGGVRQHINRFYAHARARQTQQSRLALLLAEMGYPHGSRRQVAGLEVVSARLLAELHIRLTTGNLYLDRGELAPAAELLPEIEDLLQRGIHCGALVDPWNILGFQGQYPRFLAAEDSIQDPRIEELTRVMDRLFNLYARLMSEGAAKKFQPSADIARNMHQLADWWDRFATTTVQDVPQVHGHEAVDSAEHVARALGKWCDRGEREADLAFWKEHLEGFRSPKAFALVIDALLGKEDYKASLSLLMTWLGQVEQVPLEEGEHSFHTLALRWMMGVCAKSGAGKEGQTPATPILELVARFFDFMEANAEDYWEVPRLNTLGIDEKDADKIRKENDEPEDLYGAAYEEMVYQDTTDDDVEGSVMDFLPDKGFDLGEEGPRIEKRLHFLSTLARLWNIATRIARHAGPEDRPLAQEHMHSWWLRAKHNFRHLLGLLDTIHDHQIPRPSGNYESMMEYDRRRSIKESLQGAAITTCLEQHLAVGALRGVLENVQDEEETKAPPWETAVLHIGRALLAKDADAVRRLMPQFLERFRAEPLLYTPLNQGGHPRQILRAGLAQRILQALVANFPRQGLIWETYQLLTTAQVMEQTQTMAGPRVTEFDRLFQLGLQAVVEALVDAGTRQNQLPGDLVDSLEKIIEPFLGVWMDHSQTLRVAVLETINSEKEWDRLKEFIQLFGKDLFDGYFLALGNIRAILHRGVDTFLKDLQEHADKPIKLLDELEVTWTRDEIERCLLLILQTLMENYDHFRDYQATTTQSDYGENLYQLFDFLRLKASYERQAWQMRPLNLVHEVLAHRNGPTAALWREQVQELTREPAQEHLEELARLEKEHGMRLITIRDRIEERFVQPLAIDRLCALVKPAVEQAKDRLDDASMTPLEEELRPFVQNPTGVGLDVPAWLRRLEEEFGSVQTARTALVSLAENLFQVPKVVLPLQDLLDQVQDWKSEEGK